MLTHRWGSSKLYRLFYQDYQKFLERPNIVVKQLQITEREELAVVHADLSKFYDRVSPALLHQKVRLFHEPNLPGTNEFFALVDRVFDWRWRDSKRASRFGKDNQNNGFEDVALPQGLVAGGFLPTLCFLTSKIRFGCDRQNS
ncbi:MAG: hypothetical protein R3F19_12815 [Verrucomicrobiales bacterium]